jgi:FkbM family methyltransferase
MDCICSFVEVMGGQYDAPVTITGPVTVLDIGANCGAFTLYARREWPQSTIIAFEPHLTVFKYLVENTKHLDRCSRFSVAVGDPTRTTLYECPDSRTCGSQYRNVENKTVEIPIMVVRPETLPKAEIVKIDTEGAEVALVNGLGFTPRLLLLEWHSEQDRMLIDQWALSRGMMLVKSKVLARGLGLVAYVKEVVE